MVKNFTNKSRIAKLLRFQSSNDPESLTSLDDRVHEGKTRPHLLHGWYQQERGGCGHGVIIVLFIDFVHIRLRRHFACFLTDSESSGV